jgi:pimeloyl-ACP methyl ester carboxylesterase
MSQGTAPSSRRDGGRADGADLSVEHCGPDTTPSIVLVHGAPDRSAAFRNTITHLGDWHVVVYDRRGYGRSRGAAPARTMIDHANDLLEIVASCQRPPVVVAHSFGSNPTMLAATLHPGAFAGLGLWEPPMPWVEWWPERTKAYNAEIASSDEPADDVETMYRRLLGDEEWERLPPPVRARRRAEGAAFQVDMASELEAPFAFEDVAVPVVVGYGTVTSEEHAYGARWLAERLPLASLYSIPGAGHFAPRTDPREFAAFVRSVAASVAPGQGPP